MPDILGETLHYQTQTEKILPTSFTAPHLPTNIDDEDETKE